VRACVCVVIVCARLENTFPMYVNTLDNKAVLCLMSYVLCLICESCVARYPFILKFSETFHC
jgi:hypothetical protein